MMRFLKSNKGDGSTIPILFILIISFAAVMVIFIKQIDGNLINLQKARYTKAIEMAVNTALTTVELAPAQDPDAQSNLDVVALGYTLNNKMEVDKDRLADVFLQTLFRNVQAKNINQQDQFKNYIPLLAVIQYDTLWMTAYCEKDVKDDEGNITTQNWKPYPLAYKDSITDQNIFLTLGDDYFTLKGTDFSLWKEENQRNYYTMFPRPYDLSNPDDPNNPSINPSNDNPNFLNEANRNKYLANAVASNLTGFVNSYKQSHKYYNVNIRAFDKVGFSNSIKDVTVFCFVEGIPIKTFLSNEPDRSYYSFKFGGASIKRADQ